MSRRPQHPRELRQCEERCGRAVVIFAGDTPRGTLRCEPCRDELDPAPRDAIHTTCATEHCDKPVKILGRRRRPYELGRPAWCSYACRSGSINLKTTCPGCGVLIIGNRRRFYFDRQYCSNSCHGAVRRNPERPCQECGTLFHPETPRRVVCGARCAGLRAARSRGFTMKTSPYAGAR